MSGSLLLRPLSLWGIPLVLVSLLSGCKELAHQHAARKYLKANVVSGVGLGDIQIHKTTLEDIVTTLGPMHDRTVHGGHTLEDCQIIECPSPKPHISTIELNYKKLGLIFFFDREPKEKTPEADLKLDRLTIECTHKKRCPFNGETELGIKLGDTRAQVKEVYGRPNRAYTNTWLMSYPEGISFLIDHPYNEAI